MFFSLAFGCDDGDVGGEPCRGSRAKISETEVGEGNLFSHVSKRERNGQSRENVESSTRAGNEDTVRLLET
jgi:hypothetical protein